MASDRSESGRTRTWRSSALGAGPRASRRSCSRRSSSSGLTEVRLRWRHALPPGDWTDARDSVYRPTAGRRASPRGTPGETFLAGLCRASWFSANGRLGTDRETAGRGVSPCQGGGRGFESRRPLAEGPLRALVSCPGRLRFAPATRVIRRGGRVVRQGSAKPCTPVQFRSPPRPGGTMPDFGRLAQG